MNKKKISIVFLCLLLVATSLSGCLGKKPVDNTTQRREEQYGVNITTSDNFGEETDITNEAEETFKESTTNKNITEKTTVATTKASQQSSGSYRVNLNSIPEFSGKPYVAVNGNTPGLSGKDRTARYFEKYTPLDSMGRCGVAFACLGRETMPTEERGAIGSVKPSGWHTVKYDSVDGKYLYNRCHLIGFQLSGENANPQNLITGTRYLNVEGMLPFENMVADYIKETGNHVLYRVTPIFKGTELLCRGVQIEAYSVEDEGDGVFFNVFCYNSQPGISIDYATGTSEKNNAVVETTKIEEKTTRQPTTQKIENTKEETIKEDTVENDEMVWIPNSGSRYHNKSTCSSMKDPTKVTRQEAEDLGYTPCGRCY